MTLGVLIANLFQTKVELCNMKPLTPPKTETVYGMGSGGAGETGTVYGIGSSGSGETKRVESPSANSQIKILSKPQARYTDEARVNNVQGSVMLKVVFAADGTIGSIQPVDYMPYGLTEAAVTAARQIEFEPARRNGVPVAMTKTVVYSFTIY
jgi:TonB family protein